MKKQRIVLEIFYDETINDAPEHWGFGVLLDLPSEDHAVVVSAEPPVDAEA